jgi:glutamine synthetase
VPPADHFQDLRSEMILTMERLGIEIEVQHHEVATAGQAEIDMRFDTLLVMADKLMLYKYVVKNVARAAGYTATFMPKPLFQDNGSGMHCHQSLWRGRAAVLRRRLRRLVGHGPLVHRRAAEARPGRARLRRPDHQLLQAPGPRDTRRR